MVSVSWSQTNWSTVELSVHEFKELGNSGMVLVQSPELVMFFAVGLIHSAVGLIHGCEKVQCSGTLICLLSCSRNCGSAA